MAKEWYKSLGFKKNPLNYEPRFGEALFGYDALLDEIFYRIDAGNIIFLEGECGKTSVLMKIIEKYKGSGRVAYVNCRNVGKEPNLRKLVNDGKAVTGRSIGSYPKDLIILLDNVNWLSRDNGEKIKYYFDQGTRQAIVITGQSIAKANLPQSLRHRIGKRIYRLKSLTEDEAIELIMHRLDYSDSLPESQIYKISRKSSGIRGLFENCERALSLMSEQGLGMVDDITIDKIVAKGQA